MFEELKLRLTHSPVLQLFNKDKEAIINHDGSAYDIGAVLSQRDDQGIEKPFAFFSRCLKELNATIVGSR